MVTRSGNVDNITLGPRQCDAPGAATCQCSANVKVAGFVYLISILWLFLSAVKSADISELLTFVKIKIENDMFVAGQEVMSTQTWQCLHRSRWGCLVRAESIKWCWPSICFSVNIYPYDAGWAFLLPMVETKEYYKEVYTGPSNSPHVEVVLAPSIVRLILMRW